MFLICRFRKHQILDDDVNANNDNDIVVGVNQCQRYDAYVSYDENSAFDENWVLNDLRRNLEEGPEPFQLCIKARDFIPGHVIVEAISESIQNSRRTILVLTPRFVESEWCYFEMQMARMRLFHENRDVLILVLFEEIPDDQLTLSLRQLLCRKECLKFPDDHLGQELFWRRLREELKRPAMVDRRFIT
ncbi:toll-like receptor 2 type-2 [Amphiura filiformis]|uniref:toll-like receptor 2 type-2 n=1 Tax=Amphiura filiformis TaxID=82378 RepID=UPI003B223A4F